MRTDKTILGKIWCLSLCFRC